MRRRGSEVLRALKSNLSSWDKYFSAINLMGLNSRNWAPMRQFRDFPVNEEKVIDKIIKSKD